MFGILKLFVFLISIHAEMIRSSLVPTSTDEFNVSRQSKKYGYPAIKYDVVTDDGYILQLFNIPGRRQPPVLLMHGMADAADTWLVRGNTSLAITLARAGYDVWMGNSRGNRYGRRHKHLNPDRDASFWNYTFHDHGVSDLPATIDKVLNLTGAKKINAIGHSQGNMMFYVLGSSRPEYNDKVNLLIALAPVCYIHNAEPPLNILFTLMPKLNKIALSLDVNEIFGNQRLPGRLLKAVCAIPYVGYKICVEHLLFAISGADPEEFDPETFKTVNKYFPSGISRKNCDHFGQVYNRKQFAQYDYGKRGNMIEYGSPEPPEYDLGKVKMPIGLIVGLNDNISQVRDIEILRRQLSNVVNYTISPRKKFNHMDDVWGENMGDYLFPFIFDLLKEYENKS